MTSKTHELWTNEQADMYVQQATIEGKSNAKKKTKRLLLIVGSALTLDLLILALNKQEILIDNNSFPVVILYSLSVSIAIGLVWYFWLEMNRIDEDDPAERLHAWAIGEEQMDDIIEMAKKHPSIKAQLSEWLKKDPSPVFRARDLYYLYRLAEINNEGLQKNKMQDLTAVIQAD